MALFLSSLRIKDDFHGTIDALIEFLKRIGRLRERQAMRNNLTRFGTTTLGQDSLHISWLFAVADIPVQKIQGERKNRLLELS